MMGSESVFDETQKKIRDPSRKKCSLVRKFSPLFFLSIYLTKIYIFNQLLYINVELQEVYIFISHLADVHGYMFLSTTC